MDAIIVFINNLLWGSLLVYLLLGAGAFFTIRLGFIQFRHFGHMFSVLKHSGRSDAYGISSLQALSTSLAARLGAGNLAGVATALYLGGPGAAFWMWLLSLVGMATAFAENSLGQLYKVQDAQGNYRGGPAYYMEKGLGMRWMGMLFAALLIFVFGLVFNAIQANAIGTAIDTAFGIPRWTTGVILALSAGLIIFGGVRAIVRFTDLVVPLMVLAYLLVALAVIIINITELPAMFLLIFKSAFGFEQAGGGAIGYGISQALLNGIKRGVFSSEAGMGTSPNAAAMATLYPPHPASQGYMQMLGVFIDTIVICTCTISLILLSGQLEPGSGITGVELTQRALVHEVGEWGSSFITIIILFFAFTSIVANYIYAENNVVFLKYDNKISIMFLRLLVLGVMVFGAIAEVSTMWTIVEMSLSVMALINLIAILLLSGVVIKLAEDYNGQRKLSKIPVFDPAKYPELASQLEEGIWDNKQ